MTKWLAAAMFVLMVAMGAYIVADVVTVDPAESQVGITLPTQTPKKTPAIDDLQKRVEMLEKQVADLQRQVADMNKVKIVPAQ